MAEDQITPALCQELGMVECDGWPLWYSRSYGVLFVSVTVSSGGQRLEVNGIPHTPTASNLRSIIEQLTPHEEWLRGRLGALDDDQRRQVAMLLCWDGSVRPFIQNESIDQAAAIIAGGEDA